MPMAGHAFQVGSIPITSGDRPSGHGALAAEDFVLDKDRRQWLDAFDEHVVEGDLAGLGRIETYPALRLARHRLYVLAVDGDTNDVLLCDDANPAQSG